MAEDNEGNGAVEGEADTVVPNTLAWAAHAFETTEKLKKPVWRIVKHAGKGPEGCDSHPKSADPAPAPAHRKVAHKNKDYKS